MTAALRCEGLGHRYGRRIWGLQECTLEVPPGRVVALVGPNGSGKTTLMNMAAGLLPASTGTVQIAGDTPARRLDRIGFVAQDAPLWPRLRVADVLAAGKCLNPAFDVAMAADRIRRLDIRHRARISTLSGGQRAQVALTLVLAKRPELFLLDEPMANLDPLARREFLGSMLGACTETSAAVLFSSHPWPSWSASATTSSCCAPGGCAWQATSTRSGRATGSSPGRPAGHGTAAGR